MKCFNVSGQYGNISSPMSHVYHSGDISHDVQSSGSFEDDNEMDKSKHSDEDKRLKRLLRNREAARRY